MKNYLVIGASSGIGKSLAELMATEGHNVIGTYYHNEVPDNGTIKYHLLNATEDATLDFLPDSLDGLVYCPGTINLLPFSRFKIEDFEQDFNLQVLGAIRVIKAALPALKKAAIPSIVLFSTVAVQAGFNFHSQVSTSKGAIEGLTKALAAEFSPKIRINAIAPSITDTPLASKLLNTEQKIEANGKRHPLGRVGDPKDIAQAASFLLSDASSWITGQIINVDGGISTIKK